MSGFPKGFRISKARLVNVFRKGFFLGKIRFMPPQLCEIGFHVENHATQWHGFQHEIQLQEVVVAWIQLTIS